MRSGFTTASASACDAETILAARGVVVSYESIRAWGLRVGRLFANTLKRRRPWPGDKWFLDEVFIRIRGKLHYLWRAVDQDEKVVLRRNIKRAELEAFFAKLPPTLVALKACGGSHHWGRRLAALGHRVRLISPQYVKPFVRRGKNDRNDAEAICEAASRLGMPSGPVKAAEQQADAIVLSLRELLVRQRTQPRRCWRFWAPG